ncbi:MAG: two pore domain potassium channel family protein [Gammaproteobacteria bacterium]|nr:MAG: two pore domain potassium channel family protein [Gammaproteobacteria bacterium]
MKSNFSYLLVALLILIIGVPIAYDLELISLPFSRVLGVSSILAIGVVSLRGAGRLFHVGIFLVVAGIILSVLSVASENDALHLISQLTLFVFLLLATSNTLQQVAVGNDISLNRIVGAVCVYLLLGVMWSIAYSVLEFSQPGSFKGLTELASTAWNPDWIYFSFVTITTLGYGDITPLTQTARSLTFSEAIVGQFYIAVLVAGLVSAYISAKQNSSKSD